MHVGGHAARGQQPARPAPDAAGQVALVEFAPNEDRVSPPQSAGFAIIMLAGTPAGDAYTIHELNEMLAQTGFQNPAWAELPNSMQRAITASKAAS